MVPDPRTDEAGTEPGDARSGVLARECADEEEDVPAGGGDGIRAGGAGQLRQSPIEPPVTSKRIAAATSSRRGPEECGRSIMRCGRTLAFAAIRRWP